MSPDSTVEALAARPAVVDELLPAELLDRAGTWARGSRAGSTWEAYERDWARFTRWCERYELHALPATPQTVSAYLAALAPVWRPATDEDPPTTIVAGEVQTVTGLRPATLARRCSAIAVVHRAAGHPSPTEHEAVRAVLAGIRRHPGQAPTRRRTAARTPQITLIADGLDPDDPVQARDLALVLLGYTAALRRSELAALDLDDLTVGEEGLAVRVRRSKTDQDNTGAAVGVARDERGHCPPAEALDRWREHLHAAGHTSGALWRPIHRGRRGALTIRTTRLSGRSINDIIARRADEAGLSGDFGAHSLRRGLATEAIAGGATELAVMRHGRWHSPTTMRRYIDEAERFAASNPTRHLNLNVQVGNPGRAEP